MLLVDGGSDCDFDVNGYDLMQRKTGGGVVVVAAVLVAVARLLEVTGMTGALFFSPGGTVMQALVLAVILVSGDGDSVVGPVPHHPSATFSTFLCGVLTGGGRLAGGRERWRKVDVANRMDNR